MKKAMKMLTAADSFDHVLSVEGIPLDELLEHLETRKLLDWWINYSLNYYLIVKVQKGELTDKIRDLTSRTGTFYDEKNDGIDFKYGFYEQFPEDYINMYIRKFGAHAEQHIDRERWYLRIKTRKDVFKKD